eukprot:FR741488.1.p3 GENE.FR741488.1~~FR741488.1.p3  ORF type:complete len:108 (+),score=86.91 FR741488.1:911-1234(+)
MESANPRGKRGVGELGGSFPFPPLTEPRGPRAFGVGGRGDIPPLQKGGKIRVFPPKNRGEKTPGKKKHVGNKKRAPPKKGPPGKTPKKKGAPPGLSVGGVFFFFSPH